MAETTVKDYVGPWTTRILTVWISLILLCVATIFVCMALGGIFDPRHAASISFSGSPWDHLDVPWYVATSMRAGDIMLKLMTYPFGYLLLFVPFALSAGMLLPRAQGIPGPLRKIALGLVFVIPLLAQVALVQWLHRR